MTHSDLLTRLLTIQFSRRIQALSTMVQPPAPLVQRRKSSWLVGLLLLITTESNLILTLAGAAPAIAAPSSSVQMNMPASLDPGPEPNHHRLFLPFIQHP